MDYEHEFNPDLMPSTNSYSKRIFFKKETFTGYMFPYRNESDPYRFEKKVNRSASN